MSKHKLTRKEKSYMKSIIMNTRIEYFAKHKDIRNETPMIVYEEVVESDSENFLISREIEISTFDRFEDDFENKNLTIAYRKLPERTRYILYAYFALDEAYETIGKKLNLPTATVDTIRNRALKRLRRMMKGDKRNDI